MLIYGYLHKGNFIKEIYRGSFSSFKNSSEKNQILSISEKSIELFEYSYDENLKMNFLEPVISQDLFIHILSAEILTIKNNLEKEKEILIVLTSCGILLFSYEEEQRLFYPIGNSLLNLNCEYKDKFMYIKTNSEFGLIVVYTNTDIVFVYKIIEINLSNIENNNSQDKYDLILLNPECTRTENYIIDCNIQIISNPNMKNSLSKNIPIIRLFTRNSNKDFLEMYTLSNNLNDITQKKLQIKHEKENKNLTYFYKFINNFKQINLNDNQNSENISFYSINENNVCINYTTEKEKILFYLSKEKTNNENIYISHIYLKNFLLINFEKELVIVKDELIISRIPDFIGKGKNLILLKDNFKKNKDEYIICFYDNQFNLIFVKVDLNVLDKEYERKCKKDNNNINLEKIVNDDYIYMDYNKEYPLLENFSEFNKKYSFFEILNYMENGSCYMMDSLIKKNIEISNNFNFNDNDKFDFNENKNSDIKENLHIYSINGDRGNSELILYEKALKEINLTEFDYMDITKSFLVTKNETDKNIEEYPSEINILFLDTFDTTKIFYINILNKNIYLEELKLQNYSNFEDNKEKETTLEAFFLNDKNSLIQITNIQIKIIKIIETETHSNRTNKKINVLECLNFSDEKNEDKMQIDNQNSHRKLTILKTFQNLIKNLKTENTTSKLYITNIKSIFSQKENCRYLIIYFSNFKLSLIKIDLNNESSNLIKDIFTFDYYGSISTFDLILIENEKSLLIINGTYDNKIEIIIINLNILQIKKSHFNFNSSEIIENIMIENGVIFLSTRMGYFYIFKYIFSNNIDNFKLEIIEYFTPDKNERETLNISQIRINSQNDNLFECILFSKKNIFLIEIEFFNEKNNLKRKCLKYLREDNINMFQGQNNIFCNTNKNEINFYNEFFLNENIQSNNNICKISIYQNYQKIYISHFQKISENFLIKNTLRKYSKNIYTKKLIELNENYISILFNEKKNSDEIIWGIYNFNVKNFSEERINLKDYKNLNINVFKTFKVNFRNINFNQTENLINYLIIAGEFFDENTQLIKGILFIYRIIEDKNNEILVKLIDEKYTGKPINDFCQMGNFLIFVCDNFICSSEIKVDNENRFIEIDPKFQQSYLNNLISCCNINSTNVNESNNEENRYIIVGDISESFHLMEMDSRKFRFNVVASDLNLRGLYKTIMDPLDNNVIFLLEKNGNFSRFKLDGDVYTKENSFNINELINKIHFNKSTIICTSILGSILYMRSITREDLSKYKLNTEKLNIIQNDFIKFISHFYFKRNLSLENLMNLNEPLLNTCFSDLFNFIFNNQNQFQIFLKENEEDLKNIRRLLFDLDEDKNQMFMLK